MNKYFLLAVVSFVIFCYCRASADFQGHPGFTTWVKLSLLLLCFPPNILKILLINSQIWLSNSIREGRTQRCIYVTHIKILAYSGRVCSQGKTPVFFWDILYCQWVLRESVCARTSPTGWNSSGTERAAQSLELAR